MDQQTYIIDPDGEVMIELRNANRPFAIEESVEESFEELSEASSVYESANSEHPRIDGDQIKEDIDQKQLEGGVCLQDTCFHIRASAKHLALASPVFKKTLAGGWQETATLWQKGSVQISMEGWDINALLIFLRAIHCQHNHVPRKVSLEMCAKVAVLADYYDCKEAVMIYTDIWMPTLVPTISTTYSRDSILWLWVSWFFQFPNTFSKVTSTIMSQSSTRIDNLGLPIPNKVLGKANKFSILTVL